MQWEARLHPDTRSRFAKLSSLTSFLLTRTIELVQFAVPQELASLVESHGSESPILPPDVPVEWFKARKFSRKVF
jgi:hypothetical protein